MGEHTVVFGTFGAYLILLLGIGIWADRRFGRSYQGFVSADRSLGGWVAAISSAASSESGWVMLGLSGLGYKHGYGAYWAALGCSFGFIFTAIFVVRQLRRSSGKHQVLTLGDYLAEHFGAGKRTLRTLSSLLIGFFMVVYVVAQFTSAGKQVVGMQLMDYQGGVLTGAVIIGIYVLIGGYAAVCWTDMVQGLLMLAVLIAFPIYALSLAGGFSGVHQALQHAGISSIWVGGGGPTQASIGFALTYFGFGLGYPGMPHSIIRYVTVKDEKEAASAAVISAIYGTLILFGSASLGIFGRAVIPTLTDAEKILPAFTAMQFPPILGGVILAAVSAAIMSTADSQLMMAASALVNDLWYMAIKGVPASGKTMTRMTRLVIGVLSLVALGISLLQARVIDTLVLFAWGCLGAAFSPVIMLALYWKRFNWQGAATSLVVGPAVVIIWQLLGLSKSLHGLIPGTFLSVAAAVIVTWITPPRQIDSHN